MATDRRLDERISRWLEAEAPGRLPDRVLGATFERTRTTRQQRGLPALLGRFQMPRFVVALGGAAVAVVITALALNLSGGGRSIGGVASPSPSPSATGSPSVGPSSSAVAFLPTGPFVADDTGASMTVTIPASGWSFERQFNVLTKGTEVANVPEAGLFLWSWPAGTKFFVYGDPCRSSSTKPGTPATTVDAIMAGLAAQKSRNSSKPVTVTIGGRAAKSIVLHVPTDANFETCDQGEFVTYGTEQDPLTRYHQGNGQIDELWVVDAGGATVILDAMYRPDTPANLVAELRAMAQSATFKTH